MFYSLASERSERNTIRGNSIENWGYLYVGTYVCHLYFDLHIFLC